MGKKGRGHEAEAVGGGQDLPEADCRRSTVFFSEIDVPGRCAEGSGAGWEAAGAF